MAKKKSETTEQFNLYSTPASLVSRFVEFEHQYKKTYNPKATKSEVGALVLTVGLTACEQELQDKLKAKKND